jgi:hypothetical protein
MLNERKTEEGIFRPDAKRTDFGRKITVKDEQEILLAITM